MADANPENGPDDPNPFVVEKSDAPSEPGASTSDPGALAKVYEDELRLTDRARWNVAGSRARCAGCGRAIEPPSAIHTTLVVASEAELREKHPGVSEIFKRQDHCERCFEPGQDGHAFAYWKTSTIPPPRPPRRKLNLAAILAYFDYLDPDRKPADGEDDPGLRDADFDEPTDDALPPSVGDSAQKLPPGEVQRLRYLLGLLLVRKRVLRWCDRTPGQLTLREPKSGREILVAVPTESDEELAAQMESFEELFR